MFFLEAQNTIDKHVDREDIVNGTMIVEQSPPVQNNIAKSKKHRKS